MPYIEGGRLDRHARVAQIAADQGQIDGIATFPAHFPPMVAKDFPNPRTTILESRNRTAQIACDQGQIDNPACFAPHIPSFAPFSDFQNPQRWAIQRFDRVRSAQLAQEQGSLDWPATLTAPFVVQLPEQPNPKPRPPYFHEIGKAFNPIATLPTPIGQEWPNPRLRAPYFHEVGVASPRFITPILKAIAELTLPRQRPAYFHEIGTSAALFVTPILKAICEQTVPRQRPPYSHDVGRVARPSFPASIVGWMAKLEQPNPHRPLRMRDYTWLQIGRYVFVAPTTVFRRTLSMLGTRTGSRQTISNPGGESD